MALLIDRDWDATDFGQGAKSLTRDAEANIKEVLERLRLRCPELPADLDCRWEHFLSRYPSFLWAKYTGAIGAVLREQLLDILQRLGALALRSPGLPHNRQRRAMPDGDPDAFANFARRHLDVLFHEGSVRKLTL